MLVAKNRKALMDHIVIEQYVAGIRLKGYEVKSIREKNVSFEGAYIDIKQGVPILFNMYVGKYSKQSKDFDEVDAKRPRGLLLSKREILKIKRETDEKGRTAVPLALVLDHGLVKVEMAVVKGRKEYEKKTVVKERQIKKDLDREAKERGIR